jgi:hypothetical protein
MGLLGEERRRVLAERGAGLPSRGDSVRAPHKRNARGA